MNIQSHRRLEAEQAMRDRIKDRVMEATARNEADSTSRLGAPTPGDLCTCPLCTARRAGLFKDGKVLASGSFEVGEGETLMDALGRAAESLLNAAEADLAGQAPAAADAKKTH